VPTEMTEMSLITVLKVLWIRFGFNADLDPEPAFRIWVQRFDDHNANLMVEKIIFFVKKFQYVFITRKTPALKRQHPIHFYIFLFLWVILSYLDPDPHFQDESGSGQH
jgi:hypothetical protein